jgi:hypothetical protein
MTVFYKKLNERQKAKKQGIIAVQRKLLLLVFSLWKSEQEDLGNMLKLFAFLYSVDTWPGG